MRIQTSLGILKQFLFSKLEACSNADETIEKGEQNCTASSEKSSDKRKIWKPRKYSVTKRRIKVRLIKDDT